MGRLYPTLDRHMPPCIQVGQAKRDGLAAGYADIYEIMERIVTDKMDADPRWRSPSGIRRLARWLRRIATLLDTSALASCSDNVPR